MTAAFSITLQPGGKWSARIGRGKSVTLTAAGDGANLAVLLYQAADPSERYNMPDSLKAQHTAYYSAGHVLMSDQGRVLASITEDTAGWHDPLGGYTDRAETDRKYGPTSYQNERNAWLRSGEENLTVELFRHNLTPRDMGTPVNFFSRVICEPDGTMRYIPSGSAGRSVTLRTETDVLLICSNTPHPLNPSGVYPDAAVNIAVEEALPVKADDRCVNHCAENRRAFENTWNAEWLMRGANL
ncbi:urea amidolyase associated protein UAAP1 [Paenibacillus glufosinatiresistens]|uniref:urea amidolyase associated protein UAAP1 n=1 Tax=Paenibacillus glufosinatiresistens TaxID=3070657 RepID=UPI00286D931F|nr:urea amidolyase associated protein UAAP1 [Paenibacillus sp. YX.27]